MRPADRGKSPLPLTPMLPGTEYMNIIPIPYRRLSIDSVLSPNELESRLRAIVIPKQHWFRRAGQQFEFIGKVSLSNFRLVPNVKGINTYLPWILGNIRPSLQGTRIDIVQTLHPLAIIIVVAFFLWAEYLSISITGKFNTIILLALIAFHLAMYFVGFLPEASRSEQRMKELAS